MAKRKTDVGVKIHHLTILERITVKPKKHRVVKIKCRCVCGKVKWFRASNVLSGNSTNCGCIAKVKRWEAAQKRRRPGIATNLRQLYRSYYLKAKKRGLPFDLSEREFYELTQKDCCYCGAGPSNRCELKYHIGDKKGQPRCGEGFYYNGVDRVDSQNGYTIQNSVPCCRHCNMAKSTRTLEDFAAWVALLSARLETWSPRKEEQYVPPVSSFCI